MRQRCRLAPVSYLVIRRGSVPKVGTVPLQDLHFKLNMYKFNIYKHIDQSKWLACVGVSAIAVLDVISLV